MIPVFESLAAPFEKGDVRFRSGGGGTTLAYVDARTVMQRLDSVVGPQNWQNSYGETNRGRVICSISISLNGHWIIKSDGAGDTSIEGEKGAISDAFKRAAVCWGIGRYLYDLPTDGSYPKIKTHMEWVRELWRTVAAIKRGCEKNDALAVLEAWSELTKEEKCGLWVAPTKGGIFETQQREYIRQCAGQGKGD